MTYAADMSHEPETMMSYAIDDEALATLRTTRHEERTCEVCDQNVTNVPTTTGLLLWSREDELRFEEPVLCPGCALAIGVTALRNFANEEEG